MRIRTLAATAATAALIALPAAPAVADAAKPGASMTHIKTATGLSATLESVGVVIYAQGGATSGVIGESIAAADGQVVLHVPVTGKKNAVKHLGSVLAFFNTGNDRVVQLANPVIDLSRGIVRATVPQAGNATITVLRITNAESLKPTVTRDRTTGLKTTKYVGAELALARGVAGTLNELLGLATGTIPDRTVIGVADVTLNSRIR